MAVRPKGSRLSGKVAMDTGTVSKAMTPAPPAPARAEQLAATGAVKTDLAAAVPQADDAPASRFAPSEGAGFRASVEAAMRQVIERHVTVDPRTRQLVFQAVSRETGIVVRQVPDEALLRLRAYMRETDERHNGDADVRRVERIA
jgi:flagellar protein FlaG